MMTDPSDIQQKIAELEALRPSLGNVAVNAAIAALKAQQQAPQGDQFNAQGAQGPINKPEGPVSQHFGDDVGRDKISGTASTGGDNQGIAVGVNQGFIQMMFGTLPPDQQEERKELLDAYLKGLKQGCDRLRLAGVVEKKQTQTWDQAPDFSLSQIYVTLAATDWVPTTGKKDKKAESEREEDFKQELRAGDPNEVPPQDARRVVEIGGSGSEKPRYQLQKPLLLTEAVCQQQRLVLLGGPGSGKSTFLRYLAVELARTALQEPETDDLTARLPGWKDKACERKALLPFYASLGGFTTWVVEQAGRCFDGENLWRYLISKREHDALSGLAPQLRQAFRRGNLVVLLDGLDEVADPEQRVKVARATAELSLDCDGIIVVTCRVRSFTDDVAEPLREWGATREVAPFLPGQRQLFVRGWYTRSIEQGFVVDQKEAAARASDLNTRLRELDQQERLRDLASSPLLLTIITLLHSYGNTLPDNRAELYHDLVGLLLTRWTRERRKQRPTDDPPGLLKLLNVHGLEEMHIRRKLEELAYRAHQQPTDGRGLLEQGVVRDAFIELFADFIAEPGTQYEKTVTLLAYLKDESGLLLDEGGKPVLYGLPHLTYEEYLAGCYLLRQQKFVELAYDHWQTDAPRWREVILLALGRAVRLVDQPDLAAQWLRYLLDECHGERQREAAERHPAAVFAAECLADMGGKSALISASSVDRSRLWRDLSHTLAEAVEGSTLPVAERIRVARTLADLGDPRFPVTIEQWNNEMARRGTELTREGDHYWRYVPAGTYRIGGWKEGEASADHDLPGFWIARYPITVAQYRQFIEAGGYDKQDYWTPNGWKWRQKRDRTQPYRWGEARYNSPNQAVIGVTWYECMAFCNWLTAQLAETGYEVRLPTEAEWEAAAAYDAAMQQRTYPWGDKPEPTPEHAIFAADRGYKPGVPPAPVGVCAAGAAACGALDMGGQVWEYCRSSYRAYPQEAHAARAEFNRDEGDVPRRGGSWRDGRTHVRCAARYWDDPNYWSVNFIGFRVLLSPRVLPN
jgi:formylglycine-generating enzyme required for sulfatase activity